MSTLLSPTYLSELDALRRRLRVRTRSGSGGEHLAKRRGGSAEFLEHRGYTAGDDLRRMDWLAFARTGEPVLKLFRSEEDVVFRLFVDASASLAYGTPSKLDHAKKIAASIGYLALASSERAQVIAGGDGISRLSEPIRGRAALSKLLRELDLVEPRGHTNLEDGIAELVLRAPRPGFLLVVSDFLDPHPLESALARAAQAKHEIALVQVLAPEEIEPPFEGDVALEDVETGDVVEITIDDRSLALYHARFDKMIANLRAAAKRFGATYVRTTTSEPPLDAMKRLIAKGID